MALVKLSTKAERKLRAAKIFENHGRPKRLFNIDRSYKTAKGVALGVSTAILYLAPAGESGRQLCPWRSAGCEGGCLYKAGRGSMNCTERARLAKTEYYFQDRAGFMLHAEKELLAFQRNTLRRGLVPCVRLNGTSDIKFESVSFTGKDGKRYRSLMHRFPELQFYDYTKALPSERPRIDELDNYHVTFSRSEDNHERAMKALAHGWNVAAVFRKELPDTWGGHPVLDGDESDVRFFDKPGHIVGLKAKGPARKDTSGFVIDA
jgi:hypothetical protein